MFKWWKVNALQIVSLSGNPNASDVIKSLRTSSRLINDKFYLYRPQMLFGNYYYFLFKCNKLINNWFWIHSILGELNSIFRQPFIHKRWREFRNNINKRDSRQHYRLQCTWPNKPNFLVCVKGNTNLVVYSV